MSQCVEKYKLNKKIFKNTIYTVGNISFYSEQFARDIKPMIKTLMEGLVLEDQHLLVNTLSTISNLIRHGSVHIPELIDSGTFAKMVELYSKA